MKIRIFTAAAILAIASSVASANDDAVDSKKTLQGSEIRFSLGADHSNAILTVSGPNGFYARAESKSGSAAIDLIRAGATGKGIYTYELTAASSKTKTNPAPMNNGRDGVDKAVSLVGVSTHGTFHATNGIISDRSSQSEETQ